jgi:hypothetical protein
MIHPFAVTVSSLVAPSLILTLVLQQAARRTGLRRRGVVALAVPGATALAIGLLPMGGLSVGEWVRGVNANVSIPFAGLLSIVCWEQAFGRRVLSAADRASVWMVGAIGGAVLYPFALGVGAADPYEWGWRFSPLFVMSGLLTGWLIWTRRALGWLLLLASAAFGLQLLESTNYWDYLLDPIYVVTSVCALTGHLVTRLRAARTSRGAP